MDRKDSFPPTPPDVYCPLDSGLFVPTNSPRRIMICPRSHQLLRPDDRIRSHQLPPQVIMMPRGRFGHPIMFEISAEEPFSLGASGATRGGGAQSRAPTGGATEPRLDGSRAPTGGATEPRGSSPVGGAGGKRRRQRPLLGGQEGRGADSVRCWGGRREEAQTASVGGAGGIQHLLGPPPRETQICVRVRK